MQGIRWNIIRFPGSNCDRDSLYIPRLRGAQTEFVWHKETKLNNPDVVFLPGGFSYGDYLRAGAIAKFSPVMQAVAEFADKGGLVLGVCNGFQMLTELGLLPGALMVNKGLHFICKHVYINAQNTNTPFTCKLTQGKALDIPIAHKEGNYYADEATLAQMQENNQIVFTYCDEQGNVTPQANPNGAALNIAGVCNKNGNVLGMMPHPERAAEDIVTSRDGAGIFASIEAWLANK